MAQCRHICSDRIGILRRRCSAVRFAAPERSASTPADLRTSISNDNTKSAGTLSGGVLSVSPSPRKLPGGILDLDTAPPVITQLFGEEDKAPSAPGPLPRMPLGTRVDLILRNALPDTMFFAAICGGPCKKRDTLRLAPGATGRLNFTPKRPGTFIYWGRLIRGGKPVVLNDYDGSQFAGVIVVDSGPANA